jgi:RND family efflux transporter MFP subunit
MSGYTGGCRRGPVLAAFALAAGFSLSTALTVGRAAETAPATPGRAPAAASTGTGAEQAGARSVNRSGDKAIDKAIDKAGARTPARAALSVTIVQPQRAPMAVRLAANGGIAAWQEASIGSEVQGLRLAEVRAQVGDRVRRGQVLAVFASDTVQAELAQARAALAEAEAAAAEAAANGARARELQGTGALSAQQVQQLLTGERTAQARRDAQQAALRAHELRLRQTQVIAPDDGVVSARSATVGAVAGAGQELFRLIRQGRLEWRAEVPSAELSGIQPGLSVELRLPDGAAVPGRVRVVAPTVDPATRNGVVIVDLLQSGSARAGMFARGEFDLAPRAAMTLPQSAVTLREGFAYVFAVGSDGRVVQRKVNTGRRSADRVEILSGIGADVRVVATGGGFLADGDVVRIVDTPAPAPSPAPASASR